jgi:hypothetical protein
MTEALTHGGAQKQIRRRMSLGPGDIKSNGICNKKLIEERNNEKSKKSATKSTTHALVSTFHGDESSMNERSSNSSNKKLGT